MSQAVDWDQGVSDAWSEIARAGPKLAVAVLMLLVGALVIRSLVRLADRIGEHTGVDAVLDRTGVPRLLRCPADVVRSTLVRLAGGAGLLVVARMALGVFGPNQAGQTVTDALSVLGRILLAVTLALVGLALADLVRTRLRAALAGLRHGGSVAGATATIMVLAFGKAALDEIGVADSVTTPLLYAALTAVVGVVVVGVGGGLIRPMQNRWEDILDRVKDGADEASATLREKRTGSQPEARTSSAAPAAPPSERPTARPPAARPPTARRPDD